MVKLLFQDARCSSHVPNQKRGETRLPIGSYLFLIMDEVLNIMIKQGKTRGEIHGIKIPSGVKEQIISQYADNTSMSLVGEEDNIDKMVDLLNTFLCISML